MNEPDSPHQRLGGGLLVAAWIVFILLLSALFGGWLDNRENPNRYLEGQVSAQGVREVTLQRNALGHYVADGYINDRPVRFMLDTGATTVSVPADLAGDLGLEAGAPGRAVTANGSVVTYATRLDRVTLGNIELYNVRADINPGMRGSDVLLGMSFLKQIEFVQRGNQLTLRQFP